MNQQTKALGPSVVTFDATVCAGAEPLRSPVSGLLCAHWRLRIVEHITSRMQLVHEIASPDPLELAFPPAAAGARAPARVRLDPESARIHAVPVLHREGTPGALAAARHFGLAGPVSVEEVMIRHGEEVVAEGILEDPDAADGPFRGAGRGLELLDATVRVPSRSIGPALLPWALGTAAALLGTTATITYAAWRYHLAHLALGSASSSLTLPPSSLTLSPSSPPPPSLPAQMRPPEPPHPRMP